MKLLTSININSRYKLKLRRAEFPETEDHDYVLFDNNVKNSTYSIQVGSLRRYFCLNKYEHRRGQLHSMTTIIESTSLDKVVRKLAKVLKVRYN